MASGVICPQSGRSQPIDREKRWGQSDAVTCPGWDSQLGHILGVLGIEWGLYVCHMYPKMCTVLATPELTKLCPSNSPSALVFPGQGDNSRTQYWDRRMG